jgi:hypothetical protein
MNAAEPSAMAAISPASAMAAMRHPLVPSSEGAAVVFAGVGIQVGMAVP